MQATARRLSVVSATPCARRRLIRDVRPIRCPEQMSQPNSASEDIQELAGLLSQIKSLGFDDRYDLYAELYREDWPTDAGYILLPSLWTRLATIADVVDLEVAFVVASIQRSIAVDGEAGGFDEIVCPYTEPAKISYVINLLRDGRRFCSTNLPLDTCDELISVLSAHIDANPRANQAR